MGTHDFDGSHAFARADKGGNRKRPDWENDTTCAALPKIQAEHKAYVAREGANRKEQESRDRDWKQVHQQDS